ncbi:MAG TPA: hypothetical protein VHB98_14590 [Chloroflexota bacterium]|nr:hypothetical protein [Chloroflexota bacterium]
MIGELDANHQLFGYEDVITARDAGQGVLRVLGKLPGLLLTIFALSLGAPFWFDMLQKLVNLRASGNPPSGSSSSTK